MSQSRVSTSATDASPPSSLPRLLATAGSPGLSSHIRQWGRVPRGGRLLIDEVERSGLVGRGGAGFPTGRKLAAVVSRKGAVVVANGTEAEPASHKDKTLLSFAPHLVIDGAVVAAQTVGAKEAIIAIDGRAAPALRAVRHALSERGFDEVDVRIAEAPAGYVVGEESALVAWLNGGRAKPTFGYRPFEKGLLSRPTLVNNVETLAHLALIARFGARWFRSLGPPDAPGTALFTVSGDVSKPGVYEVALGTPCADLLRPAAPVGTPQAVLLGGYAGTWQRADALWNASLDGASLKRLGATIGCGSVVVVGDDTCGLRTAATIARWMAEQSAGQCGPCINGLPAIAMAMDHLVSGHNARHWKAQIERWLWMVEGRGACKHPDGAIRMVRSAVSVFAKEIDRHNAGGPCRSPGQAIGNQRAV